MCNLTYTWYWALRFEVFLTKSDHILPVWWNFSQKSAIITGGKCLCIRLSFALGRLLYPTFSWNMLYIFICINVTVCQCLSLSLSMYTWGWLCVFYIYIYIYISVAMLILNHLPLKFNFKNTLDFNKTAFWVVTKRSLLEIYERFVGTRLLIFRETVLVTDHLNINLMNSTNYEDVHCKFLRRTYILSACKVHKILLIVRSGVFLTPARLVCCRVIVRCRWLTLHVAIRRVPVMSLWQRSHFTWAAQCAVPLAIMRCKRLQMNVPVQIYTCVTLDHTITGIGVHSAVTPVESLRQSIAFGPKSWSQSATWYWLCTF